MDLDEVKRLFPEYKKILEMSGGYKPRKFVKAIKVIKCPSKFSPSGLGDYAYRHSYFVSNGKIVPGISYSYDSMMAVGVSPDERMVDVPKGSRMWVVTFDGMWGGFWDVLVFVHEEDLLGNSEEI
ncbi:MAG: hypothetical protein PHP08_00910 [Candidatus Dojkabacteria bacterium]|nr:hypothetical protein [Candidatus Dojkabacteria bacterium]